MQGMQRNASSCSLLQRFSKSPSGKRNAAATHELKYRGPAESVAYGLKSKQPTNMILNMTPQMRMEQTSSGRSDTSSNKPVLQRRYLLKPI